MKEGGYKIGFAGTGKMGLPICLRLCDAGHEVTVLASPHSRSTPAPELLAAGCKIVHTGADLCGLIDILITCLPSSAEVDLILNGENGVFSGLPKTGGILHIDHTSGSPDISRRLAAEWDMHGGRFVDAAISGPPELARSGRLKLLYGGSSELLAEVKKVTNPYSAEIIHAGDVGSGHMLRLIGGLIGYGIALLSSEAFLVAEAAGIAPDKLRSMVTGTGADSQTFQTMAATEIHGKNNSAQRRLAIATVAKDLGALVAQAEQLHCDIPVATQISERLVVAASNGSSDTTISELTRVLKAIPSGRTQG